jgi:hypothetical protein
MQKWPETIPIIFQGADIKFSDLEKIRILTNLFPDLQQWILHH